MPNDKFYLSLNWRNLRKFKLSKNPICENLKCNNIATEVHHLKNRKDFPELELEIDNLQSLCKSCHSEITCLEIKREFKPYKLKFLI